ncbi:hypothetical protein [Maricaulis sp.]|uniref:hypothetical protein n=1 Tax=Maricaulis sp. TaxID=1486257 RepID=UPI003A944728
MSVVLAGLIAAALLAPLDDGASFPEGRYVERTPGGTLDCTAEHAAFISIRVRELEQDAGGEGIETVGRAGLVSFDLEGKGADRPLYAIRQARFVRNDYYPGDTLIEAGRINVVGHYDNDVFTGGTVGALSLFLRRHGDGDIEIVQLQENDWRGPRSAAAWDHDLVAPGNGPEAGGQLLSAPRALRRFAPCP